MEWFSPAVLQRIQRSERKLALFDTRYLLQHILSTTLLRNRGWMIDGKGREDKEPRVVIGVFFAPAQPSESGYSLT